MYVIFKINMYLFMKFPSTNRTPQDFAKKLTQEYDNLIKRGGELLSKVPVAKINSDDVAIKPPKFSVPDFF